MFLALQHNPNLKTTVINAEVRIAIQKWKTNPYLHAKYLHVKVLKKHVIPNFSHKRALGPLVLAWNVCEHVCRMLQYSQNHEKTSPYSSCHWSIKRYGIHTDIKHVYMLIVKATQLKDSPWTLTELWTSFLVVRAGTAHGKDTHTSKNRTFQEEKHQTKAA